MDPKPNVRKFLFVNKSEQSLHLSKSLSSENTSIQRHVQTGRKRSRNPKRVRRISIESESIHQSPSSDPELFPIEHSSRCINLQAQQPHIACCCTTPEWGPQGIVNSYGQTHRGNLPTLNSLKQLSKRDPFDAASVALDKPVAGLLHYYMYYYHPSQWPNEMLLLRQGVYMFEDAVLRVLRTAIADEMTMFCLLSAAACRFQFVDKLPCHSIDGLEKTYIPSALRLMASHINSENFQAPEQVARLLTCMMFLISAEGYRGGIAASKLHLNAAARLLEPLGGISSVMNETLRGQFAMADLFLACVSLEPCLLDCGYDPGPADLLSLQDDELREPEVDFEAHSLLTGNDSAVGHMHEIIEDLVESHSIKCRVDTSTMSATRAKQVLHWITLRNMAIRHRLLGLKLTDPKSHALRITIIMWTLFAMNVTGRAKTVKLMASKLRQSLRTTVWSDQSNDLHIKLWILLVGAYCANDDSEDFTWFMDECAKIILDCIPQFRVNQSKIESAEHLALFQHDFFYDMQAQKSRTQYIADTFLQMLT